MSGEIPGSSFLDVKSNGYHNNIYMDGQPLEGAQAQLMAEDRGLFYGDAATEVMAGLGEQILDLEAHLQRLRETFEKLRMLPDWSDEILQFELLHACQGLNVPKATIRLTVTRNVGLDTQQKNQGTYHRYIHIYPSSPIPPRWSKEGIKLKRVTSALQTKEALPKTSNYQSAIVAKLKAPEYDDIIWQTNDGELTECSAANVFFIGRQGDSAVIATPPTHSGILSGITRKRIIWLLKTAGIRVDEQPIFADELARFDEAFICSTIKGLIPIQSIDQKYFYSTRPNATFWHINHLFHTWVETQIGHRVDWSTGTPVAST